MPAKNKITQLSLLQKVPLFLVKQIEYHTMGKCKECQLWF